MKRSELEKIIQEEIANLSEGRGKDWSSSDVKQFIFTLSRKVEALSMQLSDNLRNVELSDIPNKRNVHTQLRKADIALGRAFEEVFSALKMMP